MHLSPRQFNLLKEMNIPVWVRRNSSLQHAPDNNLLAVPESIHEQQIFQDVIHALNLAIEDIKVTTKHIDLGTTLWQFSQGSEFSFTHNTLTTPELSQIAQSNELKIQLWQTLIQHHLV